MKKIFYILTAAVVALGAMACENEGLENVAPEVNGNVESLSFTAAIDNSRVALDGLNNVWVKGDVVEIEGFEFVCQEDGVTFVGEGDGIRALIGKEVTAWYNETIDSSKGVAGASLKGTGVLKEDGSAKLTFALQSALLKYTTAETVTFAGDALSAGFTPSNNDGVQYIPVKAGENLSVSYSVDGVTCKSITTTFEAGQIYNLGTLKAKRKIYVLKDDTYKYLYAYNTADTKHPLGTWPGTQLSTTETVNGKTFYVFTTDVDMDGTTYNYIINNNSNKEVKALDVKLDGNKYFRPSLVEIVQCSADDMKYKIYVYNQNKHATAPHLYVWNTSDSPVAGNWPGYNMTNKSAVATDYHYYDIPKSYAGKVIKFKCSLNGANESAEWSYTVNTDYFIGYYNNSGGKGFWNLGTTTAQ